MSSYLHAVNNTKMIRLCTPSHFSKDDVTALMTGIAAGVKKYLPAGTKASFRLNYVITHVGSHMYIGHCFVIVEPVAFFHVLIGNNPDGTPRTRIEYDTQPLPPWPPGLVWDQDGMPAELHRSLFTGWDESLVEREIQQPPLLTLPPGIICEVARFPVTYFDDDLSQSVLMIANVPAWVTEEHLLDLFGPYASTAEPPTFTFSGTTPRNVWISYRAGSSDALFALTMLRRCELKGTSGKPAVLLVTQAKATGAPRRPPRGAPTRPGNPPRPGGQGRTEPTRDTRLRR